jgi:hypothetical protein
MDNYLAIKKQNNVICRKINGTGNHQVQQNKPDLERQTSHDLSHMLNLGIKKRHDSK